MRPKSSRHPRAGKRATNENVPETDDLEMDKEDDKNEEGKAKRTASKDSEIGDNNDDTSKETPTAYPKNSQNLRKTGCNYSLFNHIVITI